jgi:hypothetical protein
MLSDNQKLIAIHSLAEEIIAHEDAWGLPDETSREAVVNLARDLLSIVNEDCVHVWPEGWNYVDDGTTERLTRSCTLCGVGQKQERPSRYGSWV